MPRAPKVDASKAGGAPSRRRGSGAKDPPVEVSEAGKGGVGAPPTQSPSSQMMPMMIMLVVMYISFQSSFRSLTGRLVGAIMRPTIGFEYRWPVGTIFIAGVIMVVVSTVIRSFFTDWVKMAKNQRMIKAFQEEMKEAKLTNNTYKIKRLTEAQPQIMTVQMDTQMKTMWSIPITMVVAIALFSWLGWNPEGTDFIHNLDLPRISLPWEPGWDLLDRSDTWLPHWVLMYSMASIPIGQALQKGIKLISFRRRLAGGPLR